MSKTEYDPVELVEDLADKIGIHQLYSIAKDIRGEISTTTNSYTYPSCKYRLPCGFCELKKEQCNYMSGITINPTWTTPLVNQTEVTCSAERKEK